MAGVCEGVEGKSGVVGDGGLLVASASGKSRAPSAVTRG